jgi:cytochrome P450
MRCPRCARLRFQERLNTKTPRSQLSAHNLQREIVTAAPSETSAVTQPGLPPGPSIAALQSFRYFRDPYRYYDAMKARYGDVFTMPTLNGMLVITLSAEGAREILQRRDVSVGFGFEAIEPILGRNSLLLSDGEQHRRDRNLLSPAFHGNRMRAYATAVLESAEREFEHWTPGRELRLRDAMENISLDVIIRAVFGVQNPERVSAFRSAIREAVLEVNPAVLFFKFLQRDFGGFGPWARLQRKLTRLDDLIDSQIDASRLKEKGQDEEGRDDVLSRLLAARYEDGREMDTKAIRDQLLTFLVAGQETTATTLSWAFYEAYRHPEILTRLREEIASLDDPTDSKTLNAAPYLDAFVLETLRMHPILPEFFRTVASDDCTFQGWAIPRGVTLAGSILMIHRDENLYPDALRFDPQRFLERKYSPHEFLTFGGGHRRCIGAQFATNELKLVLASLLPRVDLESTIDRPLATVRRNATLAPEAGVPVRIVEKR